MKSFPISRLGYLAIILLLVLVLAACERPLQEEPEEAPTTEAPEGALPTTQPGGITPPPGAVTTPPSGEVVPGEGDQPGSEPGGDGTDASGGEVTAEQVTYVVKAGDTLLSISQQYNVSVESLAAANGLETTALLEVDRTLVIPLGGDVTQPEQPAEPQPEQPAEPQPEQPTGEQVHVVQSGQNLYRIGLEYGCTYQELATYNGIANPDVLSVGQEIRIPANCGS